MINLLDMPMVFITLVSAVLALVLAVVNKVLVNQERMKELNKEVRDYQKRLMKASREKDQTTLDQLAKEKVKINEFQAEMMKMQMPMFASMLPFFLVFFLLRRLAEAQAWGPFIDLPFDIPFLNIGDSFTWLGWYIAGSMPFSALFRKMLGVK